MTEPDLCNLNDDVSDLVEKSSTPTDPSATNGAMRKSYRRSPTYALISFAGTIAVVGLILVSFKLNPMSHIARPTVHRTAPRIRDDSFGESVDAKKRQDGSTAFAGKPSIHHPHGQQVFGSCQVSSGTIDTNIDTGALTSRFQQ